MFRELASKPVGFLDYLLGAAQGSVGWLALSKTQNAGAKNSIADIIGKALLVGSVVGVGSLFVMAAIYSRLARRAGGAPARHQVFHVLAYGGVPMAVSLMLWVLTALLAGEVTFIREPGPDVEEFVALILQAQFFAYVLLTIWSVVLQVMGLSEINHLTTRRAFGVWVLGQFIGILAMLFLAILLAILFPNAVPG